eukprot:g1152.t1
MKCVGKDLTHRSKDFENFRLKMSNFRSHCTPDFCRTSVTCPCCGHDDINEKELMGAIQVTCDKCGWGQWPCEDGKWGLIDVSYKYLLSKVSIVLSIVIFHDEQDIGNFAALHDVALLWRSCFACM